VPFNVSCVEDIPLPPVATAEDDVFLSDLCERVAGGDGYIADVMVTVFDVHGLPHDYQLHMWAEAEEESV